jgi:hypothetical protein
VLTRAGDGGVAYENAGAAHENVKMARIEPENARQIS